MYVNLSTCSLFDSNEKQKISHCKNNSNIISDNCRKKDKIDTPNTHIILYMTFHSLGLLFSHFIQYKVVRLYPIFGLKSHYQLHDGVMHVFSLCKYNAVLDM